MRKRNIVAILVEQRDEVAVKVQQVLTAWGCMIKTRLGLHEGVLDKCTQTGLIILEMVGEIEKIEEFMRKLSLIKGVAVKNIILELDK
jgi:hypothetical protein